MHHIIIFTSIYMLNYSLIQIYFKFLVEVTRKYLKNRVDSPRIFFLTSDFAKTKKFIRMKEDVISYSILLKTIGIFETEKKNLNLKWTLIVL